VLSETKNPCQTSIQPLCWLPQKLCPYNGTRALDLQFIFIQRFYFLVSRCALCCFGFHYENAFKAKWFLCCFMLGAVCQFQLSGGCECEWECERVCSLAEQLKVFHQLCRGKYLASWCPKPDLSFRGLRSVDPWQKSTWTASLVRDWSTRVVWARGSQSQGRVTSSLGPQHLTVLKNLSVWYRTKIYK